MRKVFIIACFALLSGLVVAQTNLLLLGVGTTPGGGGAVATPTDSPGGSSYTPPQTVTLSDGTAGAAICYTTDGGTPTATVAGTCDSVGNESAYFAGFSAGGTITVKAIGTKAGMTNSGVLTSTYTITGPVYVQGAGSGLAKIAGNTGLAFNANITNGNVIMAGIFDGNAAGQTVAFSDSKGNTFGTPVAVNLATDGDTVAWTCAPITSTSGADTVKFTINGSGTLTANLVIVEIHKPNANCTQDATAITVNTSGAAATSFAISVGPITTVTANDMLMTVCGSAHPANYSAGSGWEHDLRLAGISGSLTTSQNGQSVTPLFAELRLASTTGAYTGTATGYLASSAWEYACIIAAVKA